ncbi:MAG: alpha/beta hydrolase, partial [Anaerolineales bacterium]|nr:alpha/beta hydrolase [Anaerolineales bacterium]
VTHDLGSSVGIDYMGKYAAHVEKFIILSPPVYPDFKEPAIVKLVRVPYLGEALLRVARDLLLNIGIKRGLVNKESYASLQPALQHAFAGAEGRAALLRNLRWGRPFLFFRDYPAIIKSIQVPTLIIQGKRDPYIPHAQALRLHHNIPNSRLRFIENGSHFLPLDTPNQVAQAINQFLLP